MQTDVKTKAVTQKATATIPAEPQEFNKKIGSNTYVVAVYFSSTSTETLEDKVLRLIESEVHDSA